MSALPQSLVLIGAGKMGQALLDGWLAMGLAPAAVVAVDPHLDAAGRAKLAAAGVHWRADTQDIAAPDVLLLAIKPQMLDVAASSLVTLAGPQTLVISILAGKSIADLAARLPSARGIIRAMPNTPAAVGRGISALAANGAVSATQCALATTLLGAVGAVEWLDDEGLIDAVTAVSGSGPAYVFHLVEALAQAGHAIGLPADLAMRLARATVEGAGELLFRAADTSAATLRQNVTSPGGTTAAALEHLMDATAGLPPLMLRAVAAAKKRAEDLSG